MVSNFDFLNKEFPELANFGRLAEQYCYSDANSCLIKLGMIGETMVNMIYEFDDIQLPYDNTAVKRIDKLLQEDFLNDDIAALLHGLRKARNKASHENYGTVDDSKKFLQIAHILCEWFMPIYGDYSYEHHEFVMPAEPMASQPVTVKNTAEKKKEEELLKKEQAKALAKAAEATKQPLEERKKKIKQISSKMVKTEAETRFLIDEALRKVGWEADTATIRYSKGTRPAKGHNYAIAEYPTDSKVGNKGYADYALFIGEKMVAIIEAKAMHKDVSSVIDYQGKDYAACIRDADAKYQVGNWGEYKVPFTFATNGRAYLEQYKTKSGIWFRDLRKPYNAPMALHGWMSPDGIEELLTQDIEGTNKNLQAMPYDFLTDKDGLNLREYQLKAIKAAETAIIAGRTTILLAMATGTGKTRTVLGMIYLFLKTNRFRRILFLVDRTSLGEQANDVFKEVKLEDLLTLDEIYNIKGLEVTAFKKVLPIEIKSSAINSHKSIDAFCQKYSDIVGRQVLFSQEDVGRVEALEYKPLYMLPFFLEDCNNG